jgi:hypothetical protein
MTHIYLSPTTEIKKPTISMTIKDLLATHQLCLEHQEAIAPHHEDPLHDIMQQLKAVPKPESLLAADSFSTGIFLFVTLVSIKKVLRWHQYPIIS